MKAAHRFICSIAVAALALASAVNPARAQSSVPATTPGTSQPTPALPKHAEQVRQRVEKIGVGQRITIVRYDGIEHYGTVRMLTPTFVEVAEVDIKSNVVDAYVDIKKVRKGYGGTNWVSGKRPSPVWGWIAAAAIFVPLLISLKNLD
jgi:hypothetical protein